MAATSWLRCLVLDYGDEQRTLLHTPTTRSTANRTRSHGASTTTTPSDDTLVEIFSRLPSKSVGRFRCLSRSWAARLKSASFVDLHLQQANNRLMPKLFSTIDGPDKRWIAAEVLTKPCRGLVLLHRPLNNGHYVCNPSTGQLLRLPDDERRDGMSYGLGYSPATMEYKVVRLFVSCMSALIRCDVFTLDTSAHWRRSLVAHEKPLSGSPTVRSPAVFCDGYLHFVLHQRDLGGTGTSIVAFNVVDETLVFLTVPAAALHGPLGAMVLDKCLCVFRWRHHKDVDPCCCIWRLACREAGRWEKFCCVLWPELHMPCWLSPLEIYNVGNGQKKIMFLTEKGVMAFDIPVGGGAQKILVLPEKIIGNTETLVRLGTMDLLEESLVSVGRTSEEIIYSSPGRKAWSDILKWMPTRSLVTLMCVCKEWRAVINSDRFTQTHALHANIGKSRKIKLVHANRFSYVSYYPLESIQRVEHKMMPSLLETRSSRIVCSKPCHGLILVSLMSYTAYSEGYCVHYLSNPSRECSDGWLGGGGGRQRGLT
jgi:F-box interacting protein